MALFWFDAKAGIALFQFYKRWRIFCSLFRDVFPPFLTKHQHSIIWASGMTSEKRHYWKAMERKATKRKYSHKLRCLVWQVTSGNICGCYSWCLKAHPIQFGQFYKNSVFEQFNGHQFNGHPQSKRVRDAPGTQNRTRPCTRCVRVSVPIIPFGKNDHVFTAHVFRRPFGFWLRTN